MSATTFFAYGESFRSTHQRIRNFLDHLANLGCAARCQNLDCAPPTPQEFEDAIAQTWSERPRTTK